MRLIGGLVIVPALALGCAGGVNGEIDGKAVDMLVGSLMTERQVGEGDAEVTTVSGAAFSAFGSGCDAATKRQLAFNAIEETFWEENNKAVEDADQDGIEDAFKNKAEAQVAYDEANLPTDFWTVSLFMSAPDEGDLEELEQEIDIEEAADPDDPSVGVSVCRTNDHPGVDGDGSGPDLAGVEFDVDCYIALKMDVTAKWTSKGNLTMTAKGTIGQLGENPLEDEPEEFGDVEISLSASFCEPLVEAQEDFEKIVEDGLEG